MDALPESLIDDVCRRLATNQRVRRTLPGKGRLHVDRQVPFLCVYRQPPEFEDAGTERFVSAEASYFVASPTELGHDNVEAIVHAVVKTLSAAFGAFLLVEVWASPDGGKANDPSVPTVLPTFVVHAPEAAAMTTTAETLQRRLGDVRVLKQGVEVVLERGGGRRPPNMPPLLSADAAKAANCWSLGLVVPPVYRTPKAQALFPVLARTLRRGVSLALRQTYFAFVRSCTSERPRHFHALGRNAVVKAVRTADRQLAAVSTQFDYLLHLTPVNVHGAWVAFEESGFDRSPEFHYRPLRVEPSLLKRQLYKVPVERVEDPALQAIFQEKQNELELKLTMLRDRDTPRFLFESLQLFGGVSDALLRRAEALLERFSRRDRREPGERFDAAAFAARAEEEFAFYRASNDAFKAQTRVGADIGGLMVSRGKLLINADLVLPPSRVDALLAHEVGTHLLTYFNAREQPFQQLATGLAGYEALQEGLAVLSEHLVGGLSRSRMRQLAARVVAVRALTDGASFIEVFRTLHHEHGFSPRPAFKITMRIFRGGGLTKDAVYLRGLDAVLRYMQGGGPIEPLFVGKIALEHVSIVEELQHRNLVKKPRTLPRYLTAPEPQERLAALRSGRHSVEDLVSGNGAER
jgi:uncharacterized protein (TIGR02421 family)